MNLCSGVVGESIITSNWLKVVNAGNANMEGDAGKLNVWFRDQIRGEREGAGECSGQRGQHLNKGSKATDTIIRIQASKAGLPSMLPSQATPPPSLPFSPPPYFQSVETSGWSMGQGRDLGNSWYRQGLRISGYISSFSYLLLGYIGEAYFP